MSDTLSGPRPVYQTDLPELINRGKVRDLYNLGGHMMIVATDRISAFDVVMDQPVPGKGVVLTRMSRFWLETLESCWPHHMEYVVSDEQCPAGYEQYVDQLRGRAMVVKRAEILPIECVVRGYIIGGGWKEYEASGTVSGVALPAGLRKAEKLEQPIFTPSTKATSGHDEPLSFDEAVGVVEQSLAERPSAHEPAQVLMERARDRSLAIYEEAADLANQRGIILADTKFEFGLCDGELLLADEVLTPDSSRFWPKDEYAIGTSPPSFDKQFLRDYLETLDWNKQPPPPTIPDNIIQRTQARYEKAFELLAGQGG